MLIILLLKSLLLLILFLLLLLFIHNYYHHHHMNSEDRLTIVEALYNLTELRAKLHDDLLRRTFDPVVTCRSEGCLFLLLLLLFLLVLFLLFIIIIVIMVVLICRRLRNKKATLFDCVKLYKLVCHIYY